MEAVLFEGRWLWLAIGIIIMAAALIGWMIKRNEFNRLWFIPGLVVALLGFGLDFWVETNREALERVTRTAVTAAEDGDAEALLACVSRAVVLPIGFDYERAAGSIRYRLSRPLIAKNTINEMTFPHVSDDAGAVELTVTTIIDPQSDYGLMRLVRTSWRLDFIREADGQYRIARADMLRLNDHEGIDIFSFRGDF